MDVDSVVSLGDGLRVHVEDLVLIPIPIDLYCASPLRQGVVLATVLPNPVDAPVLPRNEDSSALNVHGVLEPILSRVRCTRPRSGEPSDLIPKDETHAIVELIWVMNRGPDPDDIKVIDAGLENRMTKRFDNIE